MKKRRNINLINVGDIISLIKFGSFYFQDANNNNTRPMSPGEPKEFLIIISKKEFYYDGWFRFTLLTKNGIEYALLAKEWIWQYEVLEYKSCPGEQS
jgi:hypothetical protein